MMTDQEEEFIIDQVNESRISNQELKDDLVDHFCCVIEEEMSKGLSFEESYEKAYQSTTPNGFGEIQRETTFLLNYKKMMTMKRLTFILGFIFSISFTAGSMFKLLHLPGAGELLTFGITGGGVLFAPLLLISHFKSNNVVLSERLKWVFGSVSLFLLMLGGWMKEMHLMGAGVVLIAFFVVFGFGFLPFLFFRMYKRSVESEMQTK